MSFAHENKEIKEIKETEASKAIKILEGIREQLYNFTQQPKSDSARRDEAGNLHAKLGVAIEALSKGNVLQQANEVVKVIDDIKTSKKAMFGDEQLNGAGWLSRTFKSKSKVSIKDVYTQLAELTAPAGKLTDIANTLAIKTQSMKRDAPPPAPKL